MAFVKYVWIAVKQLDAVRLETNMKELDWMDNKRHTHAIKYPWISKAGYYLIGAVLFLVGGLLHVIATIIKTFA